MAIVNNMNTIITSPPEETENTAEGSLETLATSMVVPILNSLIDQNFVSTETAMDLIGSIQLRHLAIWLIYSGIMLGDCLSNGLETSVHGTPITDEEIEDMMKMEEIAKIALAAESLGISPEEAVDELERWKKNKR